MITLGIIIAGTIVVVAVASVSLVATEADVKGPRVIDDVQYPTFWCGPHDDVT